LERLVFSLVALAGFSLPALLSFSAALSAFFLAAATFFASLSLIFLVSAAAFSALALASAWRDDLGRVDSCRQPSAYR
jgi:hypothetical protein